MKSLKLSKLTFLKGLQCHKKWNLYDQGIFEMKDIPEDYSLNGNQWLQVRSELDQTTYIDKENIKAFLYSLSYPLYFLDFETIQPAVPMFDYSKPYQQIPFQYSLHYLEKPGAELVHKEFLAETRGDPRIPFIEQLIKDIGNAGDIVVYNQGFEVTRLKEIARDFPEYDKPVASIITRIKDLMIPFQRKYYYTPKMRGSYSIKQVLPALVQDFSYEDLEISDGSTAGLAFDNLYIETDMFKVQETRHNLMEYCKLDTLAMVKILEKLNEI